MPTDKKIARPVSTLALRLWSEAAVVAMIAMELTWITAWYVLTTHPQSGVWTTILILGLALSGSYGLGRAMNALHWRLGVKRIIFLAWLVFYVFLSVKVLIYPKTGWSLSEVVTQPVNAILTGQWGAKEYWHVLVICLLGLRGVALAAKEVEQHRVLASLQLGLLMFLLYGLSASVSEPAGTAVVFFIFLAFGMTSLSAAGVAGISDLRGGRLPRLNWAWTTGILVSALLAAGIAVLTGWLLSSKEISTFLGSIVIGVFTGLIALIALLISPVALLLFWVITQITQLMSGVIDQKVLDSFAQSLKVLNQAGKDQTVLLINATAVRNILMGGVVAAVILITLVIIRRQPGKRRLVAEENNLAAGTNRRATAPAKIGQGRTGWLNPRRLLAAAQVRRIYAQLMDLCVKLGHARPAALTPLEFLPTLKQVFPEGEAQADLITRAYVKVRYGELPETDAEVKEIKLAWNWLKSHARHEGFFRSSLPKV